METIVSDVDLDGHGHEVRVARLPPGETPLSVAVYRQPDADRDEWVTIPATVAVHPDGHVAVSGERGPVRVFVSATSGDLSADGDAP